MKWVNGRDRRRHETRRKWEKADRTTGLQELSVVRRFASVSSHIINAESAIYGFLIFIAKVRTVTTYIYILLALVAGSQSQHLDGANNSSVRPF
jgi:hypothetical protein